MTLRQAELEQKTQEVGRCGTVAALTLSEEQARQYSEWFKVLADPTRLRILNLLSRNEEPLCVCDIVDRFDLGQPTISHHLRILRDSCFVKTERRANFIYYSINRECVTGLPEAARLIMGG
ncbi:metalloregulator ArsR/SmtB family transcription factor [Leptolyngbya sp. FACHB-711]|uniref:metalloregulator ArsR/SmtB family transcription factor n=1 Tax=Leptolyngbya sp. FACHB-711 TaxID=2692813 RepID=UPI0016873C3B|nr:winged helix-turn-helix transcriptional regulator [Cyanobacteria bacterium FACHB-502]MBD2025782.1 winged helix-turn-helix transcriptional regulator [Leptolyngbya sp. FACHB-711]